MAYEDSYDTAPDLRGCLDRSDLPEVVSCFYCGDPGDALDGCMNSCCPGDGGEEQHEPDPRLPRDVDGDVIGAAVAQGIDAMRKAVG